MKQTVWMTIEADDPKGVHVRTTKPTLAEMQAAVGGLIEYAPVQGVRTMPFPLDGQVFNGTVRDVIVHEEGLLCAEPSLNVLGTLAAFGTVDIDTGRILVGDVIVVLDYDTEDETLGVEQVDEWRKASMPPAPEPAPEPVVRMIDGFVPVSEPRMWHPDFDADGDDADEHAFAEWHDMTVDDINDACKFYHAVVFSHAIVLDPTKGFLTPQGFTAYTQMTHRDATALHRLNLEAVAHMEAQGLDAWTAVANLVMATQLSLHLQANAQNIGQENFPFHAAKDINELLEGAPMPAQPLPADREPETLKTARAHFAIDRITEWCSVARQENFGAEGEMAAGLINASLLPPGWSEWIDDLAATLGGRTGMMKGDNPDAMLQEVVDEAERAAGLHENPDADDNDDDPFKEVGA